MIASLTNRAGNEDEKKTVDLVPRRCLLSPPSSLHVIIGRDEKEEGEDVIMIWKRRRKVVITKGRGVR